MSSKPPCSEGLAGRRVVRETPVTILQPRKRSAGSPALQAGMSKRCALPRPGLRHPYGDGAADRDVAAEGVFSASTSAG